jgi:tripartite-type tricarboxylate transporter receptor subunit TctC
MFKTMAGVDLLHVPYRGGEGALTALLSGTVQLYFAAPAECIQLIRAGTVRAIAITAATPSTFFPDLPTVSKFVPGYSATTFFGLGVRTGTPADFVARINHEVNAALMDDRFQARLADWAGTSLAGTPDDFRRYIQSEAEIWTDVIKRARITL